MGLSQRDRTRFARHLLLTQLGEAGQERLLAARFLGAADADPGALEVARSYLTRAGAQVVKAPGEDGHYLAIGTTDEVAQIAGTAALLEAARALVGALAAVAAITRVAALPDSKPQDFLFAISSEDA